MKTILIIFFLLLGSNSFAMNRQLDNNLTITVIGSSTQFFGFCRPRRQEKPELSRIRAGRKANRQCQVEGYESALLVKYECRADIYADTLGTCEGYRVTTCEGTFLCDGERNTCH